jgi:hypothetical protein
MADHQSAAEVALLNRQRKAHVFDALATKSDGSNPGPVAFFVPTKAEEIDARIAAARDIASHMGDHLDGGDIAADAATVWLLHRATRDARDPMHPAFGRGPRWMAEALSTDEIGALLNCLYEARERESPFVRVTDEAKVDEFAALLADLDLDDAGEALMSLQREDLMRLCVGLARKVKASE